MNILGIVGSPRKKGNTASLVEATLKPFQDSPNWNVETIYLGSMDFNGCIGCEACKTTNRCVIKDDMQDLYPKILNADAIVAGSPTYFYNITSFMKKFIDRCYCLFSFDSNDRSAWISDLELVGPKYASLIAVCEQNDVKDMGVTADVLSSSFQSMGYRITGTQKVLHAFNKGDVLSQNHALDEAANLGTRLQNTLLLKQARSCGDIPPKD